MHARKLQRFDEFRKNLDPKPNIRTARRKVRERIWPGRVDDDGDVWIDVERFYSEEPVKDHIDSAALQLLGAKV